MTDSTGRASSATGEAKDVAPCINTLEGDDRATYIISDVHLRWRRDWPEGTHSDNPFGGEAVCNEEELAAFLGDLERRADEGESLRLILNGDLLEMERCDAAACHALVSRWAEHHLQPLRDAAEPVEIWLVMGNHDYTVWTTIEDGGGQSALDTLQQSLRANIAYPGVSFVSGGQRFLVTHGDILDLGMVFHKLGTPLFPDEITPPEQPTADEEAAARSWRRVSRWSRLATLGLFSKAKAEHFKDYNRWIINVEGTGSVREFEAIYKQPPWVVLKLFGEFLASRFGRSVLPSWGRQAIFRVAGLVWVAAWLVRAWHCVHDSKSDTPGRSKLWAVAVWGGCLLAVVLGLPLAISLLWAYAIPNATWWWGGALAAVLPVASVGCLAAGARGKGKTAAGCWFAAWALFALGAITSLCHCRGLVAHSAAWRTLYSLELWYVSCVWLIYATAGIFKSEGFMGMVFLRTARQKWDNLRFGIEQGWLSDAEVCDYDHFVVGHFHYPERGEFQCGGKERRLTDDGGWVATREFVRDSKRSSECRLPLASFLRVREGEAELFNYRIGAAHLKFVRCGAKALKGRGGYWVEATDSDEAP